MQYRGFLIRHLKLLDKLSQIAAVSLRHVDFKSCISKIVVCMDSRDRIISSERHTVFFVDCLIRLSGCMVGNLAPKDGTEKLGARVRHYC
jgi:hypothetical protein